MVARRRVSAMPSSEIVRLVAFFGGRPPSRPFAREARALASLRFAPARRMGTSQSYIARLEGGKVRPSTDALERFAQATRTRLRIAFEPHPAR
jgi:hypothetical protein